jgi:hypothetical protein
MTHLTRRRILTLCAVVLASATVARGQSTTIPIGGGSHTWQDAQSSGSSNRKLYVVTIDQPERRQSCRVQSFTADKLVCSRAIGGSRTYRPQQILALIIPGDVVRARIPIWLALNAGLGASIWGTVVLTATCPACAAVTAIAAFFYFGYAGAVVFTDDVPDKLLYLAPSHELSRKMGYVQE